MAQALLHQIFFEEGNANAHAGAEFQADAGSFVDEVFQIGAGE